MTGIKIQRQEYKMKYYAEDIVFKIMGYSFRGIIDLCTFANSEEETATQTSEHTLSLVHRYLSR